MFFDEHPAFLTTSHTRSDLVRLNLRHEAIITANTDILEGATVLDLASHDGRWAYAALEAGAAHVIGVEAREHLVAAANRTFQQQDVDASRYRFLAGDMFHVLADEQLDVDVVLCLGFLYHTLRYNELFHRIVGTGARHLVIDSTVVPRRNKPLIELRHENAENDSSSVTDDFAPRGPALVGRPTALAIEFLAASYGFRVTERYDWAALLQAHAAMGADSSVRDYRIERRVTLRMMRDTEAPS